jgi:hypothetical protein
MHLKHLKLSSGRLLDGLKGLAATLCQLPDLTALSVACDVDFRALPASLYSNQQQLTYLQLLDLGRRDSVFRRMRGDGDVLQTTSLVVQPALPRFTCTSLGLSPTARLLAYCQVQAVSHISPYKMV